MTAVLVVPMKLIVSKERVMKVTELYFHKFIVTREGWPECGVWQKTLFHEIMLQG
jgi:hypothetical protein